MRQSPKTDAVGHVTAGAGSASLSATSPVGPLAAAVGVSSARFFPGRGRLPHPGMAALVHAPLLYVCKTFSMLWQASRNGASDAPDAFAAAALAALIDAAQGVPGDDGIRYSMWSWYHHTRATFVTPTWPGT